MADRPPGLGLMVLLLSLGPWLAAQSDTMAMNLRACVAYALEHAPAIRQAGLEAQLAERELDVQRKQALPSLHLRSRLQYHFARPVDIAPGSLFGTDSDDRPIRFGKPIEAGIGLTGEVPLYDRSWRVGRDAPAFVASINTLRRELSREETALEVASTFLQVLGVQAKAGLLQANVERIEQLLDLTRRQVQAGFAKPTDAQRLRVALANLDVQRQNLELQYEQLMHVLKFRMAMDETVGLELLPTDRSEPPPAPPALSEAPGPEQRTAWQLLYTRNRLDTIKTERIAASGGPALSLWGGLDLVGWGDTPAEWWSTDYWYGASFLGLRFDLPLLDAPLRRAQVERAQLEQAIGRHELATTRRSLALQQEAARTKLLVSLNALDNLRRDRDFTEEVYTLTRRGYDEGLTPIMDLLEAELAFREAESELINGQLEAEQAHLEWLHASGRLLEHFDLAR